MRETGIVRRFDNLGRIVIPKEFRRQLFGTPEKSECMPVEVFMDKDEIIIRKYIEHISDDVCEWKYNYSEYYFESSCDHLHIFMSDGPKENEYEFCPYCGKRIKIVGD